MNGNKKTSEIIRNARLDAKLSRQQLAAKYDISLRTLESWEDGERTPPEYALNLLLRCLALDFPLAPSAPKKTVLTYCDEYGKPLPARLAELLEVEFEQGRIAEVPVEDAEGDALRGRGKLYICTDPSGEISLGTLFRVLIKEE